MMLTPHDHIKGRLGKHTPQAIRDERDKWCADMISAGHSCRVIGEALGIGRPEAYKAGRRAGWVKPVSTYPKRLHDQIRGLGIKFGPLVPAFSAMPQADQDRLINLSSRRGQTIAEALVQHFVEAGR